MAVSMTPCRRTGRRASCWSNLPKRLPLRFRVEGDADWVSPHHCEILEYRHELDMAERRIERDDALTAKTLPCAVAARTTLRIEKLASVVTGCDPAVGKRAEAAQAVLIAMAGTLDILQRHDLGFCLHRDGLILSPAPPVELGPVRLRLWHPHAMVTLD